MSQILTVDYLADDAPKRFLESLHNTGFAVLKNHPLPATLFQSVYDQWKVFFDRSVQEKNQYRYDAETQTGYFPFGSEYAKGNDQKNLMEYFHYYPWGVCPDSLKALTHSLRDEGLVVAKTLLGWLDNELPSDVKEKLEMPLLQMISESQQHLLRVIHYPPIAGDAAQGEERSAAHEDIDLLTVLPAANESGLAVKDIEGNWVDLLPNPGELVINAGDMLQMCTGHYIKSTTHRVKNPVGEAAKRYRVSTPIFIHPQDDVRLSDTHTAKSYLEERLRDNRLK